MGMLAALVRAAPLPIRLPDHDEVIVATESTSPTRETPLRADVVFVLRKAGANVAVVIVEVQLRPEARPPWRRLTCTVGCGSN